MGRLVYIALGFAVGYLIDVLKEQQQNEDKQVPKMEEIEVVVSDAVKEKDSSAAKSVSKKKKAAQKATKAEALESSPAFLTEINGIGPTYAKRMFEAGIRSLPDLANSDPAELAKISKLRNTAKAEEWISEAKKLLS